MLYFIKITIAKIVIYKSPIVVIRYGLATMLLSLFLYPVYFSHNGVAGSERALVQKGHFPISLMQFCDLC